MGKAQLAQKSFLGLSDSGFHRLAYTEWTPGSGVRPRQTIICVHGLTRNSRDFDSLAQDLAERLSARVVCLDVVGRGRSGWLTNKMAYAYPQYMADACALIARLDVDQVDWVGTSMGGLLGMFLSGMPGSPIRRMVVNDIGPWVPKEALQRIASYVGRHQSFEDLQELEEHLRTVHAPFGVLSDEDWAHLVEHGHHPTEDGTVRLSYDPDIAAVFQAQPPEDLDLWPVWDRVQCPVLILRGADSDLLSAETARDMVGRPGGPAAQLIEFAGCGHAPALMEEDQIAPIRDWLSTEHRAVA